VENDIAELARLRALLFETIGGDFFNPVSADDGWRDTFAVVLKEQLTQRLLGLGQVVLVRIRLQDADAAVQLDGRAQLSRGRSSAEVHHDATIDDGREG
jgi:hypothetical protein